MMQNKAETQRDALWALLGDLPERTRLIAVDVVGTEERDGYLLETLRLDLNGREPVPAYLARPLAMTGRTPCVLYNHAHGGAYELGKEEFVAGRPALQSPPYARTLTQLGYSVLCIDHWLFGERRGRTESELFKEMLWHGQVLWGMIVYDSVRALDYLASRPDVDPHRLATLGLSMGSTMAWWLAALDERIKVCVDLCCLTDFQTLIETRGLDGHGIYYYVPGLLRSFDTADINALIAPRAHLALAGVHDRLTPPAGLDKIDGRLREVYAELGASPRWQLLRYETAHGRRAVLRFLQEWL